MEVHDSNALMGKPPQPLKKYTASRLRYSPKFQFQKYLPLLRACIENEYATVIPIDTDVSGDVLVCFYHVTHIPGTSYKNMLFKIYFHTSMVDDGTFLDFSEQDLDRNQEFSASAILGQFPPNFRVRLMFDTI